MIESKPKAKKIAKPRWVRWLERIVRVSSIIVLVAVVGFLGLALFFLALMLIPYMLGDIIQTVTDYPDAKTVYVGERNIGSSDWQDRAFIVWTPDPIEDVRIHYENYFGEFGTSIYHSQTFIASRVYSRNDLFWFDVYIGLSVANQDERRKLLIGGYAGNPYAILDNLPKHGTIIIFTHTIFSG